MKKHLLLGVTLLTSIFSLNAQTTSFETSEGFTLGAISGQNNWSLYGDTPSANAIISDDYSINGDYSLKLVSTNSQPEEDLYGVFSPLYTIDGATYEITQDVYVDGLDTANGTNLYLYNFYYDTASEDLTAVSSVIFNYDGGIYAVSGYDDAGDYEYVELGTFTADTWYNVRTRFNESGTIDYYINDVAITTINAYEGTVVNVLGFLYDDWATSYNIDNVIISTTLDANNVISSSFSVYPNPADEIVNISSPDNTFINGYEIMDYNGRVVKSESVNNVIDLQVNIANLASGIYIMRVSSDKGNLIKKIVKN
ncbi:T9SS type A sorting domain-containing protein [Flavobacterium salilacus subsp. salilacus]|uniref:T9SS type A sorting domain-containing protein n=1 Tax=Flavobacterium TaxID=237 RepID=UPI001074D1FE|nr:MULTISPECIES: T9SS type A sorting domain-containing protein [Flavobacterium]KAF2519301.1 T9SS type A sorting domain-containing protein [Flavobacterium salilacus subsp. salilacus]MBE1613491.1 T9SS type A sorting domain-containing protein [Flavobacterium sp. SaA2.13]